MFELFHHAMHMKAHFTQLMPEEQRQDYAQPHNPGICTQFRHCETNPFYPDIVQADNNAGWYATDQSGWLGMSDDDSGGGVGQYMEDPPGENFGGVGGWVAGEKAVGDHGTYNYDWGPHLPPQYGGGNGNGHAGLPSNSHPMGCWAMHDKIDGRVC